MSKKLIAPSILSADFAKLAEDVQAVEQAGADIIHVDVMDGHFVPNITIGPLVVSSLKKTTKLPFDVHLMIENPEKYIGAFAKAGADWISVHQETGYHLDRTINLIKDHGVKAGIALNPATPLDTITDVLGLLDFVLLMTVNPGFGGQKFIPYCKNKISQLKDIRDKHYPDLLIEIDGGVTTENIGELSQCGTNVFVAGSAIFNSEDYKQTISLMKSKL
ncbi:MAG: ribulose-phosphate 3-epimerase [bacterium]|nr:ribulose-phosphate 3-epimerase [bacterium]MBU1916942.1 ribulose-phosphate 3-epimerase [bacterium]